jgi:alpha-glucosidase
VRWFQFGAFCPLCRPHGDKTELREPWQFGAEAEAICRKYLQLRYRLLPYIYTAIYEACTTGIPLMRPLVLEFPDDPRVLNLSDEYLFGSDILVAPVLDEGVTGRDVYLPAGVWIDFWTDAVYTGPRSLAVPAPLDSLPLFIRQGAILPLAPGMQYSWERPLDPLTLEVYRGADGSFTLYEDDGETTGYRTGAYVLTPFQVTESAGALTCLGGEVQGSFAGHPAERAYLLNIHHQPEVHIVTWNGAAVPALATRQSLALAASGWWWDEAKGVLAIKLPRTAKTFRVQVG